VAGNSIERLSEFIGRRYERVPKRLGRPFCTAINGLPKTARLHRIFSRDLKVRLGSWWLRQEGVCSLRGEL
jgi:hypothetical protein